MIRFAQFAPLLVVPTLLVAALDGRADTVLLHPVKVVAKGFQAIGTPSIPPADRRTATTRDAINILLSQPLGTPVPKDYRLVAVSKCLPSLTDTAVLRIWSKSSQAFIIIPGDKSCISTAKMTGSGAAFETGDYSFFEKVKVIVGKPIAAIGP
jgi:hypothetical protein